MPKTRPSIPLNDGVLSTPRARVEVSCEPPRVNDHRLIVLLVCGNVGGRMPIAAAIESLHPSGEIVPVTGVSSMGRSRIMSMSCNIIMVSPHGRWNVWVSGRHRSTTGINVAESIIGRSEDIRRTSGRNPARRMNGTYCSSHVRGLCVRILSDNSHCGTQQWYNKFSPNRLNIFKNSVK
jgi:hypothetical protein